MPETWKFTIKPDTDLDAFAKCKELGIVGIGWSHGYEEITPKSYEEAQSITTKFWNNQINELHKLFEEIKPGDHLWMHKNGHYYLCIAGSKRYFASQICADFRAYDLGHAIDAKWIKVPDELVSGSIQRGVIARRMIQRIGISQSELKINEIIAKQLSIDPDWFPKFDEDNLHSSIKEISIDALFSIMSPDDVEDVVSAILQTEGWILIKSTCFRSKPKFEFLMTNKHSRVCLVQVKSGKYPQQLFPSEYIEYLNDRNEIVLFSSHPVPYPGNSQDRIRCITMDSVYNWILENWMILSPPLKMKIDLSTNKET